MLREFTHFENNAEGGDVQILFDRSDVHKKKGCPFKTVLFILSVGMFLLIFFNIITGIPSWTRHSSSSSRSSSGTSDDSVPMKIVLDDMEFIFSWITDFDYEEATFTFSYNISFESDRWFLIGFPNRDTLFGADYCLYQNGKFIDGYMESDNILKTDASQDCELVSYSEQEVVLKRKWSTCDSRDYAIEEGTTKIIFSSSTGSPDKLSEDNLKYYYINFLSKTFPETNTDSDNYDKLYITVSNVTIPEKESSIVCSTFKLKPEEISDKKQIIRFQPIVTSGHEDTVRKVELFSCSFTEEVSFKDECPQNFTIFEKCSKFLISWQYGQKSFEFPRDTGLPFGGENYSPYVLIKIHYNNFYKKNNIIDNSGLGVVLTKKLRKYDSGILEIGVKNSEIGIPPKQGNFILSGYCISDCTKKFEKIKVFGFFIHSPFFSKKVKTSVFESDRRTKDIVNEENFYNIYQESERIDIVEVNPGDVLVTTCTFDTTKNESWVMVGYKFMNVDIKMILIFRLVKRQMVKCVPTTSITIQHRVLHHVKALLILSN